jgi:hypothetical protein
MGQGDLLFVLLAANPFGGLLVAIPFALLQLHYPVWVAVSLGPPLAYLQVIAIDASWTLLARSNRWQRFLDRRRSPRVERLVASGGGFWITFFATPFIGPWLVMSFMRWARISQRKVALPILLALFATGLSVAAATAMPRMWVAGSHCSLSKPVARLWPPPVWLIRVESR